MSIYVKTNSGPRALSNIVDIVSLKTNSYDKCVKNIQTADLKLLV